MFNMKKHIKHLVKKIDKTNGSFVDEKSQKRKAMKALYKYLRQCQNAEIVILKETTGHPGFEEEFKDIRVVLTANSRALSEITISLAYFLETTGSERSRERAWGRWRDKIPERIVKFETINNKRMLEITKKLEERLAGYKNAVEEIESEIKHADAML